MRKIRLLLVLVGIAIGGLPSYAQTPVAMGLRAVLTEARQSALRASINGAGLSRIFSFSMTSPHMPPISTISIDMHAAMLRAVAASAPATSLPTATLLSKQKTDAFISDLDGTLLNSLGAWDNAASNYFKTRGIELPAELQHQVEQMSLLDGAKILKERYNLQETPEELLAATIRPVGERYYNDIPAKTYVPQLLSFLHSQGIKMAVATASHEDFARKALERLGLINYFDFIITCDEVGIGKTSPRVYEEAVKRLGVRKGRTVVVEDAPYALKTAHTAGFQTIGVAEDRYREQIPQLVRWADLFLDFDK